MVNVDPFLLVTDHYTVIKFIKKSTSNFAINILISFEKWFRVQHPKVVQIHAIKASAVWDRENLANLLFAWKINFKDPKEGVSA